MTQPRRLTASTIFRPILCILSQKFPKLGQRQCNRLCGPTTVLMIINRTHRSFGHYEVLISRACASSQPYVEARLRPPVPVIERRHDLQKSSFAIRCASYAWFLSVIRSVDHSRSPWPCKAALLRYARLRALYSHFESKNRNQDM